MVGSHTDQVLIKSLQAQNIATLLHAVLSEKLGPRLDDYIHGPVVTLDMGLGLFNVVVVKVDRLAKNIDVVLVGTGCEDIPKL